MFGVLYKSCSGTSVQNSDSLFQHITMWLLKCDPFKAHIKASVRSI